MSAKDKLKILHVLSQRPDSTGSGIYVQAMIREAAACGHENFLVAGICAAGCRDMEHLEQDRCLFIDFGKTDLSYHIPGMSDVMPYESTRFCDLSDEDISENEIVRLYKTAPERVVIAGAGYNDRVFYREEKPPPNPVQIIYAGKLSNAKGVPWLLRTLKSVVSSPWQLHLIGSGTGEEKEHCLRLAAELGEKVRIYGALPQPDLAGIMRRCHILVLPSFFEGLPLVILEGLASGCRIVATELPGTSELLGDSDADFISLVKPPRLRFTDQPYREDEPVFVQNLQEAIRYQIEAACNSSRIDLSPVQEKLNSYTWKGVFKKVGEAYLKCLNRENLI